MNYKHDLLSGKHVKRPLEQQICDGICQDFSESSGGLQGTSFLPLFSSHFPVIQHFGLSQFSQDPQIQTLPFGEDWKQAVQKHYC
mgnify:FL=1